MSDNLLADQLERWFRQRGLAAGERIPSERELAEALGWTRTQVRDALDALHSSGRLQFVSPRVRFLAGVSSGPMLLVSDLSLDDHPHRTFLHQALRGAAQACALKGRPWLVAPPSSLTTTGLGNIGGAVVLGDALADEALPSSLPPVPVVAQSDHPGIAADSVVLDQARGAALVLRWLASRGVRRPCRVLREEPTTHWYRNRLDGHRQACAALGLADRALVLETPASRIDEPGFRSSVDAIAAKLAPLMRGPEAPDSLVALSDGEVPYLAAALRRLELDPARIPIAGFDGYWEQAPERRWEPTPPAVGIDRCDAAVGGALVRMLLRRLAGELPPQPQCERIQPRLLPGIAP